MSPRLLPFVCGAVVGAAAASAAWTLSSSSSASSEPEPVVEAPLLEPDPDPAPAVAAAEPAAPDDGVPAFDGVPPPGPAAAAVAATEPPPPPAADAAPAADGNRPRRGPPRWEDMTDEQRDEMRQRFRRMHDEHATRVIDAFVERNALQASDGEALLAIADGMNERALARIQVWSDYLQVQGRDRIPKDQAAMLMRDLFSDLADSYAEVDEAFGQDWREKDPDFDLGQMVDPEVWGAMFRLAGGFGPGGGRGRGPGGGRGPRGQGGGGAPRGPGGGGTPQP